MSDAPKRRDADTAVTASHNRTEARGSYPREVSPSDAERGSAQPDDADAMRWYLPLAEAGHVIAQNNVGDLYCYGRGVEVDYVEAARWYRKAAEQGDAKAQRVLGYMYVHGQGVEKDYVEARGLYQLAADQGDAWAQYLLGARYNYGQGGVEKDYVEARRLYQLAADQGNAQAQFNLGLLYDFGEGVERDYAEARRLYQLAAEQGVPEAPIQLSWLEQEIAKAAHTKEEANHKSVEIQSEKAQNETINPPAVPLQRFMVSEIIVKLTTELLAKADVPEQDRPAMAAPVARLIEIYCRDPEAAKAVAAAITDMLATGTVTPEAGSFTQRVSRSRASATPQEPPAPVYPDIPPPPTKAPAKYAERENKRQGVDAFMLDAYARWIVPDPDGGPRPVLLLPRKLIEQLDKDCDKAISRWSSNHTGVPFPIQIDRKNGVEPVSDEEAKAARSKANWSDYQKRRQARQGVSVTERR